MDPELLHLLSLDELVLLFDKIVALDNDVDFDDDFDDDFDVDFLPELSDFENKKREELLTTQHTLDEQWEKDKEKAEKAKAKAKFQKEIDKAVIEEIDGSTYEEKKKLKDAVLDRKGTEGDLTKNAAELKELLEDYKKKHKKIHDKKKKKEKKGKTFDKEVEQEDIDDFLKDVQANHEKKNELIDKFNSSNELAKKLTLEMAGKDLSDKIEILDLKVANIKDKKKKNKKTPEVLAKEAEEDIVKQVTLDAAKYKDWKAEKAKEEKDAAAPKYSKEYLEMMLFGPGEKKYGAQKRAEFQAEYIKHLKLENKPVDTRKLSREVMKSHLESEGDEYQTITGEDAKMLLTYMLKGTVAVDDKILITKFIDKYVTKAGTFNDVFGYTDNKIKPTTYIKAMAHKKFKDELEKHKDYKPTKGEDNLLSPLPEKTEPNFPDPMPMVKIQHKINRGKEIVGVFTKTRLFEYSKITGQNNETIRKLTEMERQYKHMERNKENMGDKSDKELMVQLKTDRKGLAKLFDNILIEAGKKGDSFDVLSAFHLHPNHYHAAWEVQKIMSDDGKPLTEKQDAAWAYYQQFFTQTEEDKANSEKFWGKVYGPTDKALYIAEVYNRNYVFRNLPPEARTGNAVENPNKVWENLGKLYKKSAITVLKQDAKVEEALEYLNFYVEEMITKPVLKILKKPYVWIPGALGAGYVVGDLIYNSYEEGDYTALGAVTDFWKLDKKWTWGKTEKVGSSTVGNTGTFNLNNRPQQGWFGTGFYNNALNNPMFNAGRLNLTDKKQQLEALHLNLNLTQTNNIGFGTKLTSNVYMNNSVVLGNEGNAGVNTMAPVAGNYGQHSDLSRLTGVATNPSMLDFGSFMPNSTDPISMANILNYDESDKHNAFQPTRTTYNLRAGFTETLNRDWFKFSVGGDIESYDNFGPTGTDFQAYRLRLGTSMNLTEKHLKKKNTSLTLGGTWNRTWTNDLPDGQSDVSDILSLNAKLIMGDLTLTANYRDDLLRDGTFSSWDAGASYVLPAGPLQKAGKFTAYIGFRRAAGNQYVPAVVYPSVSLIFSPGNLVK